DAAVAVAPGAGRHRALRLRLDRDQPLSGRRDRCRWAPAERRRGDVPGEAVGPGRLRRASRGRRVRADEAVAVDPARQARRTAALDAPRPAVDRARAWGYA